MGLRASTDVGPVRLTVAGAPKRIPRGRRATHADGGLGPAKRPGFHGIPQAAVRLPGRMVTLPPPVAPAGWYPDPTPGSGGRQRWWTGAKWTRRTSDSPGPPPGGGGPAPSAPVVRTRNAARPPGLRKPAAGPQPDGAAPHPRRDPAATVRRYTAAVRARTRRDDH